MVVGGEALVGGESFFGFGAGEIEIGLGDTAPVTRAGGERERDVGGERESVAVAIRREGVCVAIRRERGCVAVGGVR
jgi:hypothetical protein